MKFHIVRNGETLEDILFLYELEKDELIEKNKHIRSWEKLIPGIKLKIPTITKQIDHEVNSMEPFIEDYYPRINQEIIEEVEESKEILDSSEELNPEEVKIEKSNEPKCELEVERSCNCQRPKIRYYNPWYYLYYVPFYYPVYNIKKRLY